MTRYDLLDIRAALDKASYWARKQADLFQIIDAKKKVEALLNEPSLPSNLDKAAKEYACEYTENDNGNGGEDWEDDIRITFMAGAEWMAKQLPLPEDSVAFQKGVQEGRRLEREDAGRLADASKTISEDLEEAAENPYVLNDVSHAAFEYERTRNDLDARSDNEVVRRAFIAGFKAGAEMMKAKMMDDAYEEEVQEVYRDEDGIHCSVSVGTDYKPGTIVYVITIPKEDEQ